VSIPHNIDVCVVKRNRLVGQDIERDSTQVVCMRKDVKHGLVHFDNKVGKPPPCHLYS
jgi:hypothetical protein